LKAADVLGKKVDWPSVDVITDRNGLRKLLRWINGTAEEKDFRIDIDLAGNRTIVLTRWEARDKEGAGWGYGQNFVSATTRAAENCKDSTGHHRVIKFASDSLCPLMKVLIIVDLDRISTGCR